MKTTPATMIPVTMIPVTATPVMDRAQQHRARPAGRRRGRPGGPTQRVGGQTSDEVGSHGPSVRRAMRGELRSQPGAERL